MLWVGEGPDRVRSADIEGPGLTQDLEVARNPGDGLVEEEGVGSVQGHHHIRGRRTCAVTQPHTPAGEGHLLVGDGAVRVEVQPRLVNEPAVT